MYLIINFERHDASVPSLWAFYHLSRCPPSSHLDPSHYCGFVRFPSPSPQNHPLSASAFTLLFLPPRAPFAANLSVNSLRVWTRSPRLNLSSAPACDCALREILDVASARSRDMWISLEVCVRSGRKSVRRIPFINHQHILGFEDLIQRLLSLCLLLIPAVSETRHHQTLSKFFREDFLYPCFTRLNLHLTAWHVYCALFFFVLLRIG